MGKLMYWELGLPSVCVCVRGYASTSVTVGVCILQASIYPVDVVTAVKG